MRHIYDTENHYYARLVSITERPIDNDNKAIVLIRLVFQIYIKLANLDILNSYGQLACREIVICEGAEKDPGIIRYAKALEILKIKDLDQWRTAGIDRWVMILFGPHSKIDDRQPFIEIKKADIRNMIVRETINQNPLQWVTTSKAAKHFACGENTIRRRVDSLASIYGDSLLIVSGTGRRKINLPLLITLYQDS